MGGIPSRAHACILLTGITTEGVFDRIGDQVCGKNNVSEITDRQIRDQRGAI